jgi:FixJ family two-component response regulator
LAAKAKKLRPQAMVVLMTGEVNVDLTANPGAVDMVLTKPVSPAQMIEVIQAKVDS